MARPKRSSKETKFQPSRETSRVLSLAGGQYAYLFDDMGKKHHLRTDSEQFISLCREQDKVLDGMISRDLKALGWSDLVEKLAIDADEG